MNILTLFPLRHAGSVALAVLIAFIASDYFSFSKEGWMILTAYLACQTSRGTPLRQGLVNLINMIAAIVVASLLLMSSKLDVMIAILLVFSFMISGYLTFLEQSVVNKRFYFFVYFSLIFLVAVTAPIEPTAYMQNRFLDVLMGGVIGVACSQWVFPVKYEAEFRSSLVPILHSLSHYSTWLTEYFLQQKSEKFRQNQDHQHLHLEFPSWVYEAGFNRGLRSGFRFFLIHLERVTDIFFSMTYLASQPLDADLLREVSDDVDNAMHKNQELLSILTEYFAHNTIIKTESDYTSDIEKLEKKLQALLPESLEFLEISPPLMILTAYIRDIKDMRKLLLQLVMALPAS